MNKLLLIFFFLFFNSALSAQENSQRILYIVDSVVIVDDPDENDQLTENDIETLEVVTNLDRIKAAGYEGKMDKIIYVITKSYATRTDEIKSIPTTKNMKRVNGAWHLKDSDTPFSGRFIDYFLNGHIQGEGMLKDGFLEGVRPVYYPNGNKSYFYTYKRGIEDGPNEEYFVNGKLKQKGTFENEQEVGLWQVFYSTGKLKRQSNFVNKKQELSKEEKKFHELFSKGIVLMKAYDYTGAIKKLNEAIILNPDYADVYFSRGTAKLNSFDFDSAIADFDKAVELEPLYKEAISNRAFARLRKYEFKDSRTLSKSKEVTILAAKDNVPIPSEDLIKICADLNLGYELGDRSPMLLDTKNRYCK
jgi:antitoxin component YwqK of YwqJK toxin-antitoxin module